MKTWIVLGVLALTVGAVAGAQQDPANPWPDHEPPPGYICVPAMTQEDVQHKIEACACLGMLDPICGTAEENEARRNSGKCKSWCKLDQCACATQCSGS